MNTQRLSLLTLTTVLGATALSGCAAITDTQGAFRSSADAPELTLTSFESCDETLQNLRDGAMPYVTRSGLQEPRMATASRDTATAQEEADAAPSQKDSARSQDKKDYSGTNNYETGVDEADIVKTDGERIFTLTNRTLRIIDTDTGELAHTVRVDGASTTSASQLLLHEQKLIVILRRGEYRTMTPRDTPTQPRKPASTVALYDVSGKPREMGRAEIEGSYVDVRQIDGQVRLISRSGPRLSFPDLPRSTPEEEAVKKNRDVIAEAPLEEWLPAYTVSTPSGGKITKRTPCHNVAAPAQSSGANLLSVHTFSFTEKFMSAEPVTLAADGSTAYATEKNLYVTSPATSFTPDQRPQQGDIVTPNDLRTAIYSFDISTKGAPTHTASGWVPGHLLNQYSLSEHKGNLRVATTGFAEEVVCCDKEPESVSSVYVLQQHGETLSVRGSVSGLGKGERIYSVRFIGSMGYVVTFRQTDPLYSVDLSDPEEPRVTGELKITGYSAYLHPGPDETLIGVGQEADTQGRRKGTQVSLFDVSETTQPQRISQYHVKRSSSGAEFDPHAFLYWEKLNLLAIPVSSYNVGRAEPSQPDSPSDSSTSSDVTRAQHRLVLLRVTEKGLSEIGSVQHPREGKRSSKILRSLIIGETLWSVSRSGALAVDAESLEQTAWVPFS